MAQKQLLRDPNVEPTKEVFTECLGAAKDAYFEFLDMLPDHEIVLDWRYYKDGSAWLGKGLYKWTTTRGTAKEKNTFWLSVWEDLFKVVFYIPEKHREDALSLPLASEVKRMVEDAKQMGKLKFFPVIFEVASNEQFDDIFKLIDFRKGLK